MIQITLESDFCPYPSFLTTVFRQRRIAYAPLRAPAASDAQRSARADRAQTNADVTKPNPEPKPTVVEPLVGLLSWEIIS